VRTFSKEEKREGEDGDGGRKKKGESDKECEIKKERKKEKKTAIDLRIASVLVSFWPSNSAFKSSAFSHFFPRPRDPLDLVVSVVKPARKKTLPRSREREEKKTRVFFLSLFLSSNLSTSTGKKK
jgi:hypothetical protein